MRLVLKKREGKAFGSDPMIITDTPVDEDGKPVGPMFVREVKVGEGLEVSDDMGYRIMAKYPKHFQIDTEYKNKSIHSKPAGA